MQAFGLANLCIKIVIFYQQVLGIFINSDIEEVDEYESKFIHLLRIIILVVTFIQIFMLSCCCCVLLLFVIS